MYGKREHFFSRAKIGVFEGLAVSAILHGCEAGALDKIV